MAPGPGAVALGAERIMVDGRLSEAVWVAAEVNSGFVERTPNPVSLQSSTRVRVAYDSEALYVAVENTRTRERPISMELRRDSFGIWSDDTITLKFDVLLDKLNTVGFAANAAGAQTYLSLNSGRQFRLEYDAIWETASTVENGVWVIEFRIPYTALGLRASQAEQIIGFNVTRDHNRRAATYDLAHMPPEFDPPLPRIMAESEASVALTPIGNPLRLLPYASGAYLDERGEKEQLDGSVGLDLQFGWEQTSGAKRQSSPTTPRSISTMRLSI